MNKPRTLGIISGLGTMVVCLCMTSSAMSQPIDLLGFAEAHKTEILAIASDEEAITWFMGKLGSVLELREVLESRVKGKASRSPISSEITNEISQFTANLASSRLTFVVRDIIQNPGIDNLTALLDENAVQYQWLLTKQIPTDLPRTVSFATSLHRLLDQAKSDTTIPPEYEVVSEYFDSQYPVVIGSKTSWITLLEEKGVEGINTRLAEFWNTPEVERLSTKTSQVTQSDRKAYTTRYVHTRLAPVFTAHLLARTIRLQAKAEERAWYLWNRLKEWISLRQETMALARLCGNWQWTVHNHQNHKDHKMTMSFFPLSDQTPGQPQPSKIVVNGDTVYLRWNFPAGFQEDSLLLSNGDKRLEGTFVNSRGPYGSITGKRLTSCQP